MSKGIAAFVVVLSLVLAITILGGVGFYEKMGVQYSTSANDDVKAAYNATVGQEAADKSGGSVLQDFTTSMGRTISTFWAVFDNLSGILQMLFGVPAVVADPIQTFFQLTFGITFALAIRGLLL